MRVAIAGAGAVGRSIAQALLLADHEVLLIERHRPNYDPHLVPGADWMFADACELARLQTAGIETCDVAIAATGDDKANLVFSMLCKSEFAVERVAARINDPDNQWMFAESWGVDVAVSTPDALVAAVEEAVSVGDLVRMMTLHQGQGSIVEITLSERSVALGTRVGELVLPSGVTILTILRHGTVITDAEARLDAGDEIILVGVPGVEDEIRAVFGDRT